MDYNAKISEIERKIPSISSLATSFLFTAIENKITDVSSLTRKQIRTQKLVKLKKKCYWS